MKASHSFRWLFLSSILLLDSYALAYTTSTTTLVFNVTGFEECVFNLVFSEPGASTTKDFIEHVVNSNPQIRAWRIQALRIPEPEPHVFSPVLLPNDLTEVCSINFLVMISGNCSKYIPFVFGSRLYNPKNALYFVHGNASSCSGKVEDVANRFIGRLDVNPIVLYLSEDNINVQRAEIHCLSCATADLVTVQMLLPCTNLLELKEIGNVLEFQHLVPVIAVVSHFAALMNEVGQGRECDFVVMGGSSTSSRRNYACETSHLLIENAAAKLNYSVEYFDLIPRKSLAFNVPRTTHALVALLGVQGWEAMFWSISPDNLVQQKLMGKHTFEFLYCTRTEKREGFNVFFWIVPFDNWSWFFIGITVLILIATLNGQWFEVYAILMRQECRILKGKQKLLMVFILATIVFTYGYEGVVSSFLTVVPPVVVYMRLMDLLDRGYKILLSDIAEFDPLKPVFIAENITTDPEIWIKRFSSKINTDISSMLEFIMNCSSTFPLLSESTTQWKTDLKNTHPDLSCNVLQDASYSQNEIFLFYGHSRAPFNVAVKYLVESGLWSFYNQYLFQYRFSLVHRRTYELQLYNENKSKPFTMSDWKILSVFIGWAVLLVLTFLVFLIEKLVHKWKSSAKVSKLQ